MFAADHLETYREKVITSVGFACAALRQRMEMNARSRGDDYFMPGDHEYARLKDDVVMVVDAEMRVLKALGNISRATGEIIDGGSQQPKDVAVTQDGVSWEQVRIKVLSDFSVQISVNGKRLPPSTYEELGFADTRGGASKPNLAWNVFLELANRKGVLRPNSANRSQLQKQMQNLRRRLRDHFKMTTDPLPFEEGRGYCAQFGLEVSEAP